MVPLSDEIPLIDLSPYLAAPTAVPCAALTASLRAFSAVIIRDPRLPPSASAAFLSLMERYFAQPRHVKLRDARPHLAYQVGVTPDHVERPRDNAARAAPLAATHRPVSDPRARARDPKWRFFWRCGARPRQTRFAQLNAPQVVPRAFEHEWAPVMDSWGASLVRAAETVAEMLAVGLGLPSSAIRDKLACGPHLLAPTGMDMSLFQGHVGATVAAYHYDLNALTVHGKARYPGLFVWTREGKRVPVNVPDGCLLVQAGAQIEHLTGGEIRRGMHEVVVSEEACAAAKKAKAEGGCMWRVSSTMFAHVRSDASLKPLGTLGEAGVYPDICAGDQVAEELKALELSD